MTRSQATPSLAPDQEGLLNDPDFLREGLQRFLQQFLDEEMTPAPGVIEVHAVAHQLAARPEHLVIVVLAVAPVGVRSDATISHVPIAQLRVFEAAGRRNSNTPRMRRHTPRGRRRPPSGGWRAPGCAAVVAM